MSGNGEGEAYIHAAGVALRRRIEELIDFGEGDDLVKFPSNLRARHTEDRPVQVDVFSARQLAMKSRADLEQARDASLDPHSAFARLGDARYNLQERRLAGAIAADDAYDGAALDLETDVLE